MTWKQFKIAVEQALQSHGVDPDAQPIDIGYIDISETPRVNVKVHTVDMPKRARITVLDA